MNSWGNEQFMVPMGNVVIPGLMPNPTMGPPPIQPPIFMTDWNGPPNNPNFVGTMVSESDNMGNKDGNSNENSVSHQQRDRDQNQGRDNRDGRSRDANRNDRGRRRSRSSERANRGGARNSDRSRDTRRDKRSKWDHNNSNTEAGLGGSSMGGLGMGGPAMVGPGMAGLGMPGPQMAGNPMMQGTMMPHFGNMMGQSMDMSSMNMMNIANMGNQVMPGMNMMPNIMDQSMMMMNQQMMMNQPIFFSNGSLLPSIHGNTMPTRREKPTGCRTIFVGGLPVGVDQVILKEIFQRFGVIENVKIYPHGVCHVRFEKPESVEQSFSLSGSRFKYHDQSEHEAMAIFIDYALSREDQSEAERAARKREPTPPRVEPYTPAALAAIGDKIKSDDNFIEAAPTLAGWLERGECHKKNANSFYSLIQTSNNQLRRLFNEKMAVDEEFANIKGALREKFAKIVLQFEQVAKILRAAKHQRVSDHFTKQQRRNIEMWLKMTEEVANIKEEFNAMFEEEESERPGKNAVSLEKYEELKAENENLQFELEGYRNEAHVAKDEAERKFEKFKAHFIAQQALQRPTNSNQVFPPLPPLPTPQQFDFNKEGPGQKVPATTDDQKFHGQPVPPNEAKVISILTAFLIIHPLGSSLDNLAAYVRSLMANVSQGTVNKILQKYSEVFTRKQTGSTEYKWTFKPFEAAKQEYQ